MYAATVCMASVEQARWGVVVCPGGLIVTRAAARVRTADRMNCSATSQAHGQLSSQQQPDEVWFWSKIPVAQGLFGRSYVIAR